MKLPCDCCEGPDVLTPPRDREPAGLERAALPRRDARDVLRDHAGAALRRGVSARWPALKTRERSDPSIALLDAWATVGDVLTFYQERIANEGYLRTATERRSVLELARLVGYALAARRGGERLPRLFDRQGRRAGRDSRRARASNSVPGPGEQMQAFETAEPLEARYQWNTLGPRLDPAADRRGDPQRTGSTSKGRRPKLKANDPLLVDFADGLGKQWLRVESIETDNDHDRTRVRLRGSSAAIAMTRLKKALAGFRALQRFDVSPDAAMTKRVIAVLDDIETVAGPDPPRSSRTCRRTRCRSSPRSCRRRATGTSPSSPRGSKRCTTSSRGRRTSSR